MKSMFLLCMGCILFASGTEMLFGQSMIDTMQTERTITVRGEATIDTPVDYISLSFTVSTLQETPEESQNENNTLTTDIVQNLISKFNMKSDLIYTEQSTLFPEYDWRGSNDTPKKLLGYTARRSIIVKIYDRTQYDNIVLTILESSVDQITNIRYVLSTDEKYYNQGLTLAVEHALQKATILSQETNTRISHVLRIQEITPDTLINPNRELQAGTFQSSAAGKNNSLPHTLPLQVKIEITYAIF